MEAATRLVISLMGCYFALIVAGSEGETISHFSPLSLRGLGLGVGGKGGGKGGHEKSNHLHELVSAAAARHTERHSYEIHCHLDFTCGNKKKGLSYLHHLRAA